MWIRSFACIVALGAFACDSAAPNPSECSTGSVWTGGDEESALMHPGGDCIDCHASDEGPSYEVAGTVMAASDDPTDCNGVQGVTVRLVDADDVVHETVTNAAGNFWFGEHVPGPFTAEVERDGVTSAMITPQVEGNCASCHTEVGENGAPGRIVAPDAAS